MQSRYSVVNNQKNSSTGDEMKRNLNESNRRKERNRITCQLGMYNSPFLKLIS